MCILEVSTPIIRDTFLSDNPKKLLLVPYVTKKTKVK
jgi:hypothetical protein